MRIGYCWLAGASSIYSTIYKQIERVQSSMLIDGNSDLRPLIGCWAGCRHMKTVESDFARARQVCVEARSTYRQNFRAQIFFSDSSISTKLEFYLTVCCCMLVLREVLSLWTALQNVAWKRESVLRHFRGKTLDALDPNKSSQHLSDSSQDCSWTREFLRVVSRSCSTT
jgi:hypothetical protein